ncbi:hypothetical protein ACET3Z_004581 [Daucus carota]
MHLADGCITKRSSSCPYGRVIFGAVYYVLNNICWLLASFDTPSKGQFDIVLFQKQRKADCSKIYSAGRLSSDKSILDG